VNRRNLTIAAMLGIAALLVGAGCSQKYSAERDGKKLGEAVCDLSNADSQEEIDSARADIKEQLDDLGSKTALYTGEDRARIDENINDVAEHVAQQNEVLLQQDLTVIERNVEQAAEQSNEVSAAAWEGVLQGLSDCTQ
jgi:hypothetical protein